MLLNGAFAIFGHAYSYCILLGFDVVQTSPKFQNIVLSLSSGLQVLHTPRKHQYPSITLQGFNSQKTKILTWTHAVQIWKYMPVVLRDLKFLYSLFAAAK